MTEIYLTVQDGMVVGLDYTLRLDYGTVISSSVDRQPLELLQGQGQVIPGLERALYGMAVGDEKQVVVAPADGYGEMDPYALEMVSHDVFPPGLKLKVGMRLNMRDQQGQTLIAYVASIGSDGVLLDFNHPLAGETLYFDVKIASLRAATREELGHGHRGNHQH